MTGHPNHRHAARGRSIHTRQNEDGVIDLAQDDEKQRVRGQGRTRASRSASSTVSRADRFRFRDMVGEAVVGLSSRPGRLALTALVVVVGIASLVATIGLAQTGAYQLQTIFDQVAATHGRVRVASDPMVAGRDLNAMPWDADERAARLNGVVAAGLVTEIDNQNLRIQASPVFDPAAAPARKPGVVAATPGALAAVSGAVAVGRWIDWFHEQRAERVAVLGDKAARLLGVTRVDNQPAVFIDDVAYTVIGIIHQAGQTPSLLEAVIVPQSTARSTLGLAAPKDLHVRLELGAGPLVAGQIGLALNPNQPAGYDIAMPPPPSKLRAQLTTDINSLFLILGLVALVLGGVTIAVVSSLSIIERRGEIGLRRAIGATRGQVAAQFVTETSLVGLLGGLSGAAVGVLTVVMVAAVNAWTPVLDLRIVGAATLTGTLLGTVSGLVPAIRAARLEPATALQQGIQ